MKYKKYLAKYSKYSRHSNKKLEDSSAEKLLKDVMNERSMLPRKHQMRKRLRENLKKCCVPYWISIIINENYYNTLLMGL